MHEQFEKIAQQIPNCTFRYKDYKVGGIRIGSKIHASLYQLRIEYKGHIIVAEYELGQTDVGRIVTIINDDQFPAFSIQTRNFFDKLFSRNKTTFVINCKNDVLKDFIERRITISKLDEIEKTNAFEPQISTSVKDQKTIISTTLHLQFTDKIEALHALIKFYQALIDFHVRRN